MRVLRLKVSVLRGEVRVLRGESEGFREGDMIVKCECIVINVTGKVK